MGTPRKTLLLAYRRTGGTWTTVTYHPDSIELVEDIAVALIQRRDVREVRLIKSTFLAGRGPADQLRNLTQ